MEPTHNKQTGASTSAKQFAKKSPGKKPKSKKGKPAKKLSINPILAEDTMAGTSTYAQFMAASGQSSGTGNKEVNITLTDFIDIDPSVGDWSVMHYDPSSLPGVTNGAPQSTRLRHCRVSLLQGPINVTSHAEVNVGVLSGVLCSVGAWLGADFTLAAAKQTIVAPSSTPKWVTVFDCNLSKLAAQGLEPAVRSGQSEVFRLSLIDPDNGSALATEFTMQAKVELSYSTAFPLETGCNYILGTSSTPLAPAEDGTVINGPVFPRVTGVSNGI